MVKTEFIKEAHTGEDSRPWYGKSISIKPQFGYDLNIFLYIINEF
jgi:hypothetical protein